MILRIATKLSFVCLASGCWPGPLVGERIELPIVSNDGGYQSDGGVGVRFQQVLNEVLVPTCADSFCHQGNPPSVAPMSLEPEVAYAQLVNAPSSQEPSLMRVKPGDPTNSYVLVKLRAHTSITYGTTQMPLNKPPLDDKMIDAIESWIARGAPND
jgi:hypothetical protein